MSLVQGTVETGVELRFEPSIIAPSGDLAPTGAAPIIARSTPSRGQFALRLTAGVFKVQVTGIPRWGIEVPNDNKTYQITDLVIRTYAPAQSDEFVRKDGSHMTGPLILHADPTEISHPRQAATTNYVLKVVAKQLGENRYEHVQTTPIQNIEIQHGLGRRAQVTLVDLYTDINFLAAFQHINNNTTRFEFGSTRAFRALFT